MEAELAATPAGGTNTSRRAFVAWSIWALAMAAFVGAVVLNIVNASGPAGTTNAFNPIYLMAPGFATVGALIASRSENRIGRLFLAVGVVAALNGLSFEYAVRSVSLPSPLPFGGAATVFENVAFPLGFLAIGTLLLLFPDGRLPSRRWKPIAWAFGVLWGTLVLVGIFDPQLFIGHYQVQNPFGLPGLRNIPILPYTNPISTFFWSFVPFALLFIVASAPFIRRRKADRETKQQLRWLALVVAATLVIGLFDAIVIGLFPAKPSWFEPLMGFTLLGLIGVGIPVAVGIAVMKYRLYDLDVVVRKTVVFGVLAVFITLMYAAIVGGIGAVVGSASSTTLSFVAAVILAVLFQPVRERAQRIADRVVYGKRATPYEVLAVFSDRMSEGYAADEVLPEMARVLGEGTGAERASVLIRLNGILRPEVTWPEGIKLATQFVSEVRYQGEDLGALVVDMPPSDPMNPAKAKLVEDLASQAGLVIRNVRLIEELRESRRRIVTAQDERAKRIERNLHDGAQQQLIALTIKTNLAQQLAIKDPEKSQELLTGIKGELQEAIETLRDLARGIYPPLLADQGLAVALDAQARKAAVPTTVESDGLGRYPQEIEAAVYFCTLEALQNIAKYAGATQATVRLRGVDHTLEFEVTDNGAGFDMGTTNYGTGMQGMADRIEAVDGTLTVRSSPGSGTSVKGSLRLS